METSPIWKMKVEKISLNYEYIMTGDWVYPWNLNDGKQKRLIKWLYDGCLDKSSIHNERNTVDKNDRGNNIFYYYFDRSHVVWIYDMMNGN